MKSDSEQAAATVRRLILKNLPKPLVDQDNPSIFGPGGPLDSLGLVNFVSDLEYQLTERFGREIVLASDRAMSRTRSPFRDASALTEYVLELLNE